ncbi:MAG: hypothetical protein FD174_3347 [Geobacteraceae bacterium]|nr:MAG: hypothetical protein FD174_3347 [Geobacteraceae bacterium]
MMRILALFLLMYPALAAAADINIEGRVFTESGPLNGAKVYAYKSYEDIQSGAPAYISEATDNKGLYKAQLPEGEYYFTARGIKDGKEYSAYHGKNPIKVKKEDIWVTLIANEIKLPPVYEEGVPSLNGIVTYKGQPVKGAYVAIYTPESRPFRGLGLRTESVGGDGRFNLAVPPGKYVVIAKKIESGKGNKPLKKGDLFCYYPQNPVEVKSDKTVQIEVPCYPKDDRNAFVDTPSIKTNDYATLESAASRLKTGIQGKVTDAGGKPVAGITVLAYKSESPVFMMYHLSHGTEKSGETDKNGNYFIHLDKAGDYNVVARDTLGDGPHKGEIYGLYQGNSRHVVSYNKAGVLIDNVNITVGKVMAESLEAVRLPPDKPEKKETTTDKAAAKGVTIVADRVVDRDTVWQGNILIKGVVSVKRGATLTIKPGTVIKFSRIDQDDNGFGDGEILVEGRMVARGTGEKRIIFTSAEERPQINDWSYVQFIAAETDNVIEYCQFEWAYSGVMVHYSNVKISDSVFTNNNRGLHFNTANLLVEHNNFVNNKVGIRFMRFEGNISVKNNVVRNNDVGVLFVRQHINAVDFMKLDKSVEPPHFFNNNIFENFKYNVSLGDGQNQDINISNNWWGEDKKEKIEKTIYDNEDDNELSRVVFFPFLTSVVQGVGVRD